jgi:NadR type nicotinamide-nucleotide adenylyltransferase
MIMIKKIVVIGPESTGKTMLCMQLAKHFKADWVPEYAREFLETSGADYNYDDIAKIADGQIRNEEQVVKNFQQHSTTFNNLQQLVFVDTDMYVIKVWSEFVFNKCDNKILNQIVERKYDLYLLCNTDIPWIKDSLREYPDLIRREQLFHHYKDAMVNQATAWVEIKGEYEERLGLAIQAVESIL